MSAKITDKKTIELLLKKYPDKLMSCKCEDEPYNDCEIALISNLNNNDNTAYMVFVNNLKIESMYKLDFKNPYADFIKNTGHNYNMVYIHPDIKEAFKFELKYGFGSKVMQYYCKPFKSLLVNENEKILNDIDSVLKENNKTSEDDNSCMEDLFKSLNNLKDNFKDVVKNMDIVKGSDCLYDDEDYPFKEYGNRETLKEISDKMTKWVDSITEQNKEAGNIK